MPTTKTRSTKRRSSTASSKTGKSNSASARKSPSRRGSPNATKQLESEVRELRANIDAISRSQAVIEFELDGTIITANNNFLNTVGYSLDEIQGQHHRMFVEESYASSAEYRQFWNALAAGEFIAAEFQRFGNGGREIWIQASYNPIFDADGRPYKVVKYASDITEAKQMALEITESKERAGAQVEQILSVVNRAAEGDYSEEITVAGDDAIGSLADGLRSFLADKKVADTEMARISSMMEQAPINIMFADTDFKIRYMNPASRKTLQSIESHLPIKAADMMEQSIDVFHKNPSHQRRILSDPNNLPVQSNISVGPETLDLQVSPVYDQNRNYLGAMVTWEVITKKLEMERQIKEKTEQERQQAELTQQKVDVVLELMNSVADGQFDLNVPDLGDDAIGKVASALEKAVGAVRDALQEVREVSGTVATAANQMSGASDEIATGAQRQAARLEETASSLEEITTTVKQNSENAQEARQLANGSRDVALEGGNVVGDAVQAMSEINDSSKQIADIITTIDEIAFQTNLLALNAAVEAARAGEQGRGFAVVASEVRNLAQRSASSAKEIKSLIQDSASKVQKGTELVNKSGETLGEIVDSVKRVTDIVAEIAAASQEQMTGIEQVNKAVAEMDRVTQANASQTEEMNGTSRSVLDHASQLNDLVGRFQLGNDEPQRNATPSARNGHTNGHSKGSDNSYRNGTSNGNAASNGNGTTAVNRIAGLAEATTSGLDDFMEF